MKFRLIIDRDAEEEVVITAHARTELIDRIENLVQRSVGQDRIAAYTDDGMKMLPLHKIECITILDRKTIAIDREGTRYQLKLRLYELEELLPSCFIRINKSAIANEHRILRFDAVFSGGVDAVFRCGFRDYVSRRCFAEIRRRYEGK